MILPPGWGHFPQPFLQVTGNATGVFDGVRVAVNEPMACPVSLTGGQQCIDQRCVAVAGIRLVFEAGDDSILPPGTAAGSLRMRSDSCASP